MLTIHTGLRHFAKVTAKDTNIYALSGVNVAEGKNGRVLVTATDGKRLIHADAPSTPDDFPQVEGFKVGANGAQSAIVPAKEFTQALKGACKKTAIPMLRSAAVTLEEELVTIATTTLDTSSITPIRTIDGCYPDAETVFNKDRPEFTVYFNAKNLGDTLKIIADALKDAGEEHADTFPVRLDFHGKHKAVQISAGNQIAECGKISALVMPLVDDKFNIPRWKALEGQEDVQQEEVENADEEEA